MTECNVWGLAVSQVHNAVATSKQMGVVWLTREAQRHNERDAGAKVRQPREQLDPPYDIKLVFLCRKITSVLRKINKNCKRAYFQSRLEIFSPNLV